MQDILAAGATMHVYGSVTYQAMAKAMLAMLAMWPINNHSAIVDFGSGICRCGVGPIAMFATRTIAGPIAMRAMAHAGDADV